MIEPFMDDNSDMERHEFPEGEEPDVLMGISPECEAGRHAECTGIGEIEEEPFFCASQCHEVPREA
jgi:hypothetical protein